MPIHKKIVEKKRGFTLIEIIVSLGIFSIVAVIAVGALVRVTSANKQAQAIQSGVNNVSFILDAISREMRVGTAFKCVTGPDLYTNTPSNLNGTCSSGTGGDAIISFNPSNTDPSGGELVYAYLFHVSSDGIVTIFKAEETSTGQGINIGGNSAPFFPVTSSGVKIQDYKVGVYGGTGSTPYSWVFIRLYGYVGTKVKDQSVFDVQTSISERSQG
ncbi:MAG TPA: type II secretion system protein [Candidatus Paceibacterota bacterium]|jgi:prepilin-type N-terminal cleavage/methylation domain-containing protein|nr:type II secretion system protein [Candidatus Paceibacterota bacterium]